MSRISKTFSALSTKNEKALVTFITAGFPDAARCREILFGLPDAGADIIELGMPFTDPMADGALIQAANNIALSHGHKMQDTLNLVSEFRALHPNVPLVLMGYANPIFHRGVEKFMADAAMAGVDGLIIVDMPPEEDSAWRAAAQANNIDMIRLITPTADAARIGQITAHASGFLYYVTITGITGAGAAGTQDVARHIAAIRADTKLPIVAGFGIKTPGQAGELAKHADGVVVGSALIERAEDSAAALTFVSELKAALQRG
jgi:tryptophan synthase alpha chain